MLRLRSPADWVCKLENDSKLGGEVAKLIQKIADHYSSSLRTIVLPYEQQPWQIHLIADLRSRKTHSFCVVGYIHSHLTSSPVQFVFHRYCPDILYVHGDATRKFLIELLGWPETIIRRIPSMRFRKRTVLQSSMIYLPYDFLNLEEIFSLVKQAILEFPLDFAHAHVKLHPYKVENRKHQELRDKIQSIVGALATKRAVTSTVDEKPKPTVVTVGLTGATLELLESGYSVISVVEDDLYGWFDASLWPELNVTNVAGNPRIKRYELKASKSFIDIEENQKLQTNIVELLQEEGLVRK